MKKLPKTRLNLNAAQRAVIALLTEYNEETDRFTVANPNGSGYTARWWARDGIHAERIYFETGRKDAKAYIQFYNPATLADPKLIVRIEDNGTQPPRWYADNRDRLASFIFPAERAVQKLAEELREKPIGIPVATEEADYKEIE